LLKQADAVVLDLLPKNSPIWSRQIQALIGFTLDQLKLASRAGDTRVVTILTSADGLNTANEGYIRKDNHLLSRQAR